MSDIVKAVTNIRFQANAGKCRAKALAEAPPPVHAFLNINQLAWPRMLVEVDIIAITRER